MRPFQRHSLYIRVWRCYVITELDESLLQNCNEVPFSGGFTGYLVLFREKETFPFVEQMKWSILPIFFHHSNFSKKMKVN